MWYVILYSKILFLLCELVCDHLGGDRHTVDLILIHKTWCFSFVKKWWWTYMLSVLDSLGFHQIHLKTWAVLNSCYFGCCRFHWAAVELLRWEHVDGWLLLGYKVQSWGCTVRCWSHLLLSVWMLLELTWYRCWRADIGWYHLAMPIATLEQPMLDNFCFI